MSINKKLQLIGIFPLRLGNLFRSQQLTVNFQKKCIWGFTGRLKNFLACLKLDADIAYIAKNLLQCFLISFFFRILHAKSSHDSMEDSITSIDTRRGFTASDSSTVKPDSCPFAFLATSFSNCFEYFNSASCARYLDILRYCSVIASGRHCVSLKSKSSFWSIKTLNSIFFRMLEQILQITVVFCGRSELHNIFELIEFEEMVLEFQVSLHKPEVAAPMRCVASD